MSKQRAERLSLEYLGRLGIAEIVHKRNPALTPEERFSVMLLRAAMVRDAMILIDRPFLLVPHLKDVQFITDALKKIDDLYISCHIYDYQWTKEKYGDL
ncbi:MAG: hypothetical protein EG826_04515 [Deltaproteobacteria bacterium]|nr:hypothetical protein [Deltaproteobacteria bacterium]